MNDTDTITLPPHLKFRTQQSKDYGFRLLVVNVETDVAEFFGDWYEPGIGQSARAEEATLYWWAHQE